MLTPDIITIDPKICVGKCLTMSLSENRISELWRSFMPEISNIPHRLNKEIISAQVYQSDYFKAFDPSKKFTKWAAVEVNDTTSNNNDEYRILNIPGGLYAVFHYKGLSNDTSIFQNIFGTYLPASEYELDQRPHFEILGDKYKNMDPESEEDIYIPIRLKTQ